MTVFYNMAALIQVNEDLRLCIETACGEELHIFYSESRNKTHNNIFSDPRLLDFLIQIKCSWNENTEESSIIVKPNMLQFLLFVSNYRSDFLNMFSVFGNQEDINELFNFYINCTWVFDTKNYELKRKISLETKQAESTETEPSLPGKYKKEVLSSLIRLGGGTLAQIWRVSKKLKEFGSSENIKKSQKQIYDLVFCVKQSDDEKEELPLELKNRDKGAMFFPKKEFIPFIEELNNCVRSFANEESIQKYGKGMIKVCVSQASNLQTVRSKFDNAIRMLNIAEGPGIDDFFNVWARKITHARIQEYLDGRQKKEGKKGGQTLRDSLYSNAKQTSKTKKLKNKLKTSCTAEVSTQSMRVNKENKKIEISQKSKTEHTQEYMDLHGRQKIEGEKNGSNVKQTVKTDKLKKIKTSCTMAVETIPLKANKGKQNCEFSQKTITEHSILTPSQLPKTESNLKFVKRNRKRLRFDDYVYE